MLFEKYKDQELVWLNTLAGETEKGNFAFRGDLIVTLGALNEAAKKRNPPEAIIKEAIILIKDDELALVVGNFADVDELPQYIEKFEADMDDDCRPLFFIDNLKESVVVDVNGRTYTLIAFNSGMIWNELLDVCYLEKSDLKPLKGEDKVEAVFSAYQDIKHKFPSSTLDEILSEKTTAKREAWGAV